MKTMTCKQLGGACDRQFHGETFEEIAEQSKKHGMEMFQANDTDHLKAMNNMKELMKEPGSMKQWFEDRKREFDLLPDKE